MENLRFVRAGNLRWTGSWPIFELPVRPIGTGLVYLWVEIDREKYTVVYVGKAGSTLQARCRQHVGGFKGGSTTGRAHMVRLRAGFEAGRQYAVYARKSKVVSVFGHSISMVETEEQALIQKFAPPWNKARLGSRIGMSDTGL